MSVSVARSIAIVACGVLSVNRRMCASAHFGSRVGGVEVNSTKGVARRWRMSDRYVMTKSLIVLLLCSCAADGSVDLADSSVASDGSSTSDDGSKVPTGCGDRPPWPRLSRATTATTATREYSRTFFPVFADAGSFEPAASLRTDVQGSVGQGYVSTEGNRPAMTLLDVPSGDELIGVSWWACGNGVSDAAGAVWVSPSYAALQTGFSGSNVQYGLTLDLDRSDVWAQVSMDFTPKVVQSTDYVGLFFESYGSGYVVGAVTISLRRPQ